ncbi:hypothetical protein AB0L65_32750 [Nonomuraea sp. NPDC052116]|uniref:hypothetical protein n=1 Tax=Nonomuraea sp. NPDC052116 TaxID=3155665 RepID=UPI0034271C34
MTTSGDDYDYGPLQTYEVTWKSGHVERVQCHQITHPGSAADAFGLIGIRTNQGDRRIHMHGEFDGRWLLVLSALEDDIRAIRLVTGGEEFAGERFDFGGEAL